MDFYFWAEDFYFSRCVEDINTLITIPWVTLHRFLKLQLNIAGGTHRLYKLICCYTQSKEI